MKSLFLVVSVFFSFFSTIASATEAETFGILVDKKNGITIWLTEENEPKYCPDRFEKAVMVLDKDQNYRGAGCWRMLNKQYVSITIKHPSLFEPLIVPLDVIILDAELKKNSQSRRKN